MSDQPNDTPGADFGQAIAEFIRSEIERQVERAVRTVIESDGGTLMRRYERFNGPGWRQR
jgi:hypothetical protein